MSYPLFSADRGWDVLTSRRHNVLSPHSVGAERGRSLTSYPETTAHSRRVRVLVADDDLVIQDMVATYLDGYDIHVIRASSWGAMQPQLTTAQPRLVLLSLRLGEENGLSLLREIRSRSDVPIITTGHGCNEVDRVRALELGADDHLTKPFGLRELVARIRAILRRREDTPGPSYREAGQGGNRFGGWELDRRAHRLIAPGGSPVALTKGEYTLLIAFLDAPQRPLTREYLLQATRIREDVFDRSIDAQIFRLRRKLEFEPRAPRFILTERGVGYTFAMPVERF